MRRVRGIVLLLVATLVFGTLCSDPCSVSAKKPKVRLADNPKDAHKQMAKRAKQFAKQKDWKQAAPAMQTACMLFRLISKRCNTKAKCVFATKGKPLDGITRYKRLQKNYDILQKCHESKKKPAKRKKP